MIRYLSRGEIAERLGITLSTVKSYDQKGYLPAADAQVGRNFGWLPETIDAWMESRPGRGTRTDLDTETAKP